MSQIERESQNSISMIDIVAECGKKDEYGSVTASTATLVIPPSESSTSDSVTKEDAVGLIAFWVTLKSVFLNPTLNGIGLCLLSSFFLSMATNTVSDMKNFNGFTKSFWRFAGTFFSSLFLIPYYIYKKENVLSSFMPVQRESLKVLVSLIARSIFGCTGATFQYLSVQRMSPGDSSVICNAYPFFVLFIATLVLKEPFGGYFMAFAAMVTFLGVGIIARPQDLFGGNLDSEHLAGVGFAVGCAVFLAVAIVLVRHLQQIHYFAQLIFFGGVGTMETAILALAFGEMEFPTDTMDILKGIAIGVLSFLSQLCLIFALKCDNAGPISLVKTSDVLFTFLLQTFFFHRPFDTLSGVGAAVMMLGILLSGFRKVVQTKDEDSKMRRVFWFVLK